MTFNGADLPEPQLPREQHAASGRNTLRFASHRRATAALRSAQNLASAGTESPEFSPSNRSRSNPSSGDSPCRML